MLIFPPPHFCLCMCVQPIAQGSRLMIWSRLQIVHQISILSHYMDGIHSILQSPISFLSLLKLNTTLKVQLIDDSILLNDDLQGTCGSISFPISKDHQLQYNCLSMTHNSFIYFYRSCPVIQFQDYGLTNQGVWEKIYFSHHLKKRQVADKIHRVVL